MRTATYANNASVRSVCAVQVPAPASETVFRALLDFLYTDSCSPLADPGLTCELLTVAAALGISRLVSLCEVRALRTRA